MKRGLALDFAKQALLSFACMTLGHWILNTASYNACGAYPTMPYDATLTASSSEFAWSAWESAALSYNACTRPYNTAQVFLWMITWAFFVYAGWRRIQLRRRFGLPGDDVRDYTAWVLCPLCAVCQEARTLEHNRVVEGVWHGPGAAAAAQHLAGPAGFPGVALFAPPQQQPYAGAPHFAAAPYAQQQQQQQAAGWGAGAAPAAGLYATLPHAHPAQEAAAALPPPPPVPPPPPAAPSPLSSTAGMYEPPKPSEHAA
jgi:Cys-rich protein (TIGR01571 family)